MTLVGPCVLLLGVAPGEDFGDFVTDIQQVAPEPVVLAAINRDYSDSSGRGYKITLTGVQETLDEGTLWRYLWDNFGLKDHPITWSPLGAGDVYFQGLIASIPDPKVGGKANQHGQFDISLPLVERPVIVAAPVLAAAEGADEGF